MRSSCGMSHLGVAEHERGVELRLAQRIEEGEVVRLLVELDLAADGKAAARHVEGGDIEAEEAGKLRLRRRKRARARANAHRRRRPPARKRPRRRVEADIDRVAAVFERGERRAVADFDANLSRAFGQDALEIGRGAGRRSRRPARCARARPESRHRLCLRIDEFNGIDWVADLRASGRSGPCGRRRPSRCRRSPSCSLRRASPARARSPAGQSRGA